MIRPIHVQGARGLVLQSARARLQRRPRHHPDPHLRGHQRRAGAGAARQGLRRLLALEQSQHRRRQRKDRQALHPVRLDVRRLRRACRPRRRRSAEPGGQLRQHPRRGARDRQSCAGAPVRADGRYRRRRPLARRCGVRKDIELRCDSGAHDAAGRAPSPRRLRPVRRTAGQPAETVLGPDGNAERLGSKDVRPLQKATSSASGSTAQAATAIRASAIRRRCAKDVADGYVSPSGAPLLRLAWMKVPRRSGIARRVDHRSDAQ